MLFKNPKKGEMVIDRTNEMQKGVYLRFISAVTHSIVKDVYAIETRDEKENPCFVVESNVSYEYGKDSLPQGIVGVAYSLRGAGEMAHDYIKTKSQEIRTEYYPNHTLVDKVQFK